MKDFFFHCFLIKAKKRLYHYVNDARHFKIITTRDEISMFMIKHSGRTCTNWFILTSQSRCFSIIDFGWISSSWEMFLDIVDRSIIISGNLNIHFPICQLASIDTFLSRRVCLKKCCSTNTLWNTFSLWKFEKWGPLFSAFCFSFYLTLLTFDSFFLFQTLLLLNKFTIKNKIKKKTTTKESIRRKII